MERLSRWEILDWEVRVYQFLEGRDSLTGEVLNLYFNFYEGWHSGTALWELIR